MCIQYSDAQESSLQHGPKMVMQDGGWGERTLFRTFGNWERSGSCEKGKGLERQRARQGTDVDKGVEVGTTMFGCQLVGQLSELPEKTPGGGLG